MEKKYDIIDRYLVRQVIDKRRIQNLIMEFNLIKIVGFEKNIRLLVGYKIEDPNVTNINHLR